MWLNLIQPQVSIRHMWHQAHPFLFLIGLIYLINLYLNTNLSANDRTSDLQYRYCYSSDARTRIIKIGNLVFFSWSLITTTALTNNSIALVKIPSDLIPSSNVICAGFTNNNDSSYPRYPIPFTMVATADYNLSINYTSLGGTLAQGSWLWGSAMWVVGH